MWKLCFKTSEMVLKHRLCIVDFKGYDTYHATHKMIFDINDIFCLVLDPKNLIYKFYRNLSILMTKI